MTAFSYGTAITASYFQLAGNSEQEIASMSYASFFVPVNLVSKLRRHFAYSVSHLITQDSTVVSHNILVNLVHFKNSPFTADHLTQVGFNRAKVNRWSEVFDFSKSSFSNWEILPVDSLFEEFLTQKEVAHCNK